MGDSLMDAINPSMLSHVDVRKRRAMLLALRIKRCGDLTIALLLLIQLLPLLAIVAIATWLTSAGPVFFAHQRVGYGGRVFNCYKFRTMYANAEERLERLLAENCGVAAEWSVRRKLDQDPRITPLGRFLRTYSMDELPQLWNVLRGDMSLIGPRPVTEDELLRYGNCARWYSGVHPGLTGLWQVNGRSRLSYAERVELDRAYAERWSLGRDLAILVQTPAAVLLRRGAQ
jgi:exopolysaccharide production protein ExoY